MQSSGLSSYDLVGNTICIYAFSDDAVRIVHCAFFPCLFKKQYYSLYWQKEEDRKRKKQHASFQVLLNVCLL